MTDVLVGLVISFAPVIATGAVIGFLTHWITKVFTGGE